MTEKTRITEIPPEVFETNLERGLDHKTAETRLAQYGKNQFDEPPKDSILKKFFHSLTDFTTMILIAAAIISFYNSIVSQHGDYFEGILII